MSTNSKGNGEAAIETKDLSVSAKLDVLIEAINELVETNQELVESVKNLSLPGSNYDVDEYDT